MEPGGSLWTVKVQLYFLSEEVERFCLSYLLKVEREWGGVPDCNEVTGLIRGDFSHNQPPQKHFSSDSPG